MHVGALPGDALLGLVDLRCQPCRASSVSRAVAAALSASARSRVQPAGLLAGVGQALLVGGDQGAGVLVGLLGRVEVALDLGLPLVERVRRSAGTASLDITR